MYDLTLKPSYWASVSGGKDSLFMLKLILSNPDKYPLDGVVHFELEIDYPFISNVIDYMESECKKANIPFLRIKPRVSWFELYEKYGFPSRSARWCNSLYKLDSSRQLESLLNSKGLYCVHYIGFCADEVKRFKKQKKDHITEIYPLAEFNIKESYILEWARSVDLFNNYYKFLDRCGCMFCPMLSRKELAYILLYYPDKYELLIKYMSDTEKVVSLKTGKPFAIMNGNSKYNAQYIDNIVRSKYYNSLLFDICQLSFFD